MNFWFWSRILKLLFCYCLFKLFLTVESFLSTDVARFHKYDYTSTKVIFVCVFLCVFIIYQNIYLHFVQHIIIHVSITFS